MKTPLVFLIFLKRSLVFPILLFSSISLHWSLRKAFLSLALLCNSAFKRYIFPFLLCFSLLFFSQLFVRPPQTAVLLFCISFSWGWSCSVSCTMSWTSVHSTSGTLSIRSSPVLKNRDIILPTKVRLVKAMVFPVVMYGYESWTIKKAELRRTDAYELWCWKRPLSVFGLQGDPTSPS